MDRRASLALLLGKKEKTTTLKTTTTLGTLNPLTFYAEQLSDRPKHKSTKQSQMD